MLGRQLAPETIGGHGHTDGTQSRRAAQREYLEQLSKHVNARSARQLGSVFERPFFALAGALAVALAVAFLFATRLLGTLFLALVTDLALSLAM
jgi:type VI protein secretion system component VasF